MSTEPLHDAPDSRTNLPRRHRSKHPQDSDRDHHSSFPDSNHSSTSEAGPAPLRRPSRTATVARAARSMLGSSSGFSALESQLDATADDSRSYQPSLSRIAEGRALEARNSAATTPARHRPRVAARSRLGRYSVEDQRRLQERVRAALTSPSMQSVLSSLTTATSSSSGSNSTLTQGSYERNDAMPRQGERRSRHSSSTRHGRDRRRRHHHRDRSEPPPELPAEKVNVFNFLENGSQTGPPGPHDAAWLSSPASSSSEDGATDDEEDDDDDDVDDDDDHQREQIRRTYTPTSSSTHSSGDSPVVQHKPFRPQRQWAGQDQPHSDSGISVRGGSPDSLDRDKQPRVEAEEDADEHEERMDGGDDSDDEEEEVDDSDEEQEDEERRDHSSSRRPSPAIPAANHTAAPNHPTPWRNAHHSTSGVNGRNIIADHLPPQPPPYSHASLVPYAAAPPMHLAALEVPPPAPEPPPPRLHVQPPTRARKAPQPAGYDALATALSPPRRDADPPPLPPLYRRFERLNHRILLHLQDEIAEMEEALHGLDANIAHASAHHHHPHPASRRADARFGSDAHFARTDLLGRIFIKLRDYNDALSGFRGALAAGPAPPADDLARYRARMDELRPVAQHELRFLGAECEGDLVRVASGPAGSTAVSGGDAAPKPAVESDQVGIVLLAVATSLAVAACAFSHVKHGVTRLTLVAVLVGAAYVSLQRMPSVVVERERRGLFLVGFAVVLVGMAGVIA